MRRWREQLPQYIIRFNSLVSLVVWAPAWAKALQTHSAKDYSLLSLGIILYLQASNLLVAILDRSKNLKFYLIVNTATVGATFLLVWWLQK